MDNCIMIGADVHDKSMSLKIAQSRGRAEKASFANNSSGRKAMLAVLHKRVAATAGARVIFAYEASGLGFGLHDEISADGFECHVLAPTLIASSPKSRRNKTDEKDAERILDILRAHVLAGNELPAVWVPDQETRDDREIVRARLDAAEKITRLKAQVRTLLKRNNLKQPSGLGKGWTNKYRAWLRGLLTPKRSLLRHGARVGLGTLLRQLAALEQEITELDQQVKALSECEPYAEPAHEIMKEKGPGLLTAMVFLTEMGDLSRFSNRRQIGAYLGLVPSSNETGQSTDRKGHITHQGNPRVRKVLCQAVWARVRTDPQAKAAYARIVKKNPKHKKIAVVASMRRLAILMWHIGLIAQERSGCFKEQATSTAA